MVNKLSDILVGDIVKVKATTITTYGIFCTIVAPLMPNYAGLIHISEISDFSPWKLKKLFKIHDEFWCQVIGIIKNSNKIQLSFKSIREELLIDKPKVGSKNIND